LRIGPTIIAMLLLLCPLAPVVRDVEFTVAGNGVIGVWGTQAELAAATGAGAMRRNVAGLYTSRPGVHYFAPVYCIRVGRLRWVVFLDSSRFTVGEG
jgi:hypothetical protein